MPESPSQFSEALEPKPGPLLSASFSCSMVAALLLTACSLIAIISPLFVTGSGNIFSVLGGIGLLFATTFTTFVLYRAVLIRNKDYAFLAQILFWLLAFFSLFAVVSNALEAITKSSPGELGFWLVFVPICLLVTALAVSHAILYGRWAKVLDQYEKSQTLCRSCQYDLRGSIAANIPRCPECGTEISKLNP